MAQTKFTYADLLRLRSVADVAMSPDGRQIAYTVSAIDQQEDGPVKSLWVMHTENKKTTQVALTSTGAFAWAPDGRQLAVASENKEGKSAVSLLRADDLQILQSFPIPSSPGNLVWSPDGELIAFSLHVPEPAVPSFLEQAVRAAQDQLEKTTSARWAPPVQITQAAQYRKDGGVWLKPANDHLFVLSITSGKLEQIGTGPFDDLEPAWMPDHSGLLFTSDRRPERMHSLREPAIFKVDFASGRVTQLTHPRESCHTPVTSPDGKWIAYTGSGMRLANYTRTDLFIMRIDGSGAHQIATRLDRDLGAPKWSGNSKSLYAEYDDHGISRIGLFGLDNKTQQLASGMFEGWDRSRNGDITYSGSSPSSPSELKLQQVGTGPVVLTSLNDFLHQRKLGRLIHLNTRSSADGVPVEGWALLPAETSGKEKLPAILSIHGGPFGDDGPDWSSTRELYAAAGYAVVYANYRGSISYGASFSEPANRSFPGLAYDDLMSITDEAVRRGIADSNRLFVTGGSAGGELATWIVGKTKRFRAVTAEKPVTDNLSESLVTDQYLGALEFTGGLPWTREKELWSQSPLSLAGSMTTPTMFIVGEDDYRTPLDQTLQLYGALQLQGVRTALMRVPGAGHESLAERPSQLAAEIAATLAWFQKYDPMTVD